MLKIKIIAAIIFIMMNNCGTVKAPLGSVPGQKNLATDAFGSWISLNLNYDQNSIEGELIAIDSASLIILKGDKIQRYLKANIDSARIILFNTHSAAYGTWTFLGSLATLSNGAILLFTLPITLITGIATTVGEARRTNFYDYPAMSWDKLSKYARFPQGITDEIDLSKIKPRHFAKK